MVDRQGGETGDQWVGDLLSQKKITKCREEVVTTEIKIFSYFYYSFI